MFIGQGPQSHIAHQGFHNRGIGNFNPNGGMSSQLRLMMQMMQMMMMVMEMVMGSGGNQAMSMGRPNFGGGSHGFPGMSSGQGSPANFLGMPYGRSGNNGSPAPAYNGGSHSGSHIGSQGASAPSGAARTDVGTPQSAGNGYIKPLDGNFRISSGFGPRKAPKAGASSYHKGVDLAAPTGTPVRATKGGTVSISQHQTRNGKSAGYGNWIEVKHDDGTSSRYGHLNTRDVKVGQRLEAGQVLGTVGNTGTSTGAHLHFEIRNAQGQAVDPQKVMKF